VLCSVIKVRKSVVYIIKLIGYIQNNKGDIDGARANLPCGKFSLSSPCPTSALLYVGGKSNLSVRAFHANN
jgi:hypothetical protein